MLVDKCDNVLLVEVGLINGAGSCNVNILMYNLNPFYNFPSVMLSHPYILSIEIQAFYSSTYRNVSMTYLCVRTVRTANYPLGSRALLVQFLASELCKIAIFEMSADSLLPFAKTNLTCYI